MYALEIQYKLVGMLHKAFDLGQASRALFEPQRRC